MQAVPYSSDPRASDKCLDLVNMTFVLSGGSQDLPLPGFSPPSILSGSVASPSSLNPMHNPSGMHRNGATNPKRKDSKTTRVRTVLNEKQLHTLRTCYAANCRPDALMKEQLTEMTGLSARVIRVWFQNKRCKDKKRSLALKQLQEQQSKQQNINEQVNIRLESCPQLHHDHELPF